MAGSVLRTPISAKYCWFGWWLGAWSTPSHHPTQLCDIYISGYEYTLISEWTRLFWLLWILDNLISGAVCYFLYDYFCILWNIHLTHARSCSCHHSLSWVVFMPSSGVGLVVSVPISYIVFNFRGILWRSTNDYFNNLAVNSGFVPHWRLRRSGTNVQSFSNLTPSGTDCRIV